MASSGFLIYKNNMKYNLLQKSYDKVCDYFIHGIISYHELLIVETRFIKESFLFTIYLN